MANIELQVEKDAYPERWEVCVSPLLCLLRFQATTKMSPGSRTLSRRLSLVPRRVGTRGNAFRKRKIGLRSPRHSRPHQRRTRLRYRCRRATPPMHRHSRRGRRRRVRCSNRANSHASFAKSTFGIDSSASRTSGSLPRVSARLRVDRHITRLENYHLSKIGTVLGAGPFLVSKMFLTCGTNPQCQQITNRTRVLLMAAAMPSPSRTTARHLTKDQHAHRRLSTRQMSTWTTMLSL